MDARLPVCEWTCENVVEWLRTNNLSRYEAALGEKHAIDGTALLLMNDKDLREAVAGENVVLGDLKRLLFLTRRLRASAKCTNVSHRMPSSRCVLHTSRRRNKPRHSRKRLLWSCSSSEEPVSSDASETENYSASEKRGNGRDHAERERSHWFSGDSSTAVVSETETEHDKAASRKLRSMAEGNSTRRQRDWVPEPEYLKAFLSFIYVFGVIALTALVMVIVHERLPDMSKYPPLPDLVLDHLPMTWWAFEACELCGSMLFAIFTAMVTFHKHRFIVLRRAFSLTGTIFLLRSITMLVTSLSVPHLRSACKPMPHSDWPSRFERALAIWAGFGMRIRGVETCGDYMFSGHTSIMTILNHFITEYTPRSYYRLHTLCWLLNLFGAFFILLSHEHYTLDVFVAFWISSRLFLYYHTLANNAVTLRRDRHRTRVWFPLFNYFEARSVTAVPNEFELPFTRVSLFRTFALIRDAALHAFHFVQAVIASTRPRITSATLSGDNSFNGEHSHAE